MLGLSIARGASIVVIPGPANPIEARSCASTSSLDIYALPITVCTAFKLPTTAKHINGLTTYEI